MLQLKGWIGIEITQLEWKTWYMSQKNVKALAHSQQQPQGPKSHKKKPTIRLTIRQCSVPCRGPFFTGSWSCLKSYARYTLSNKSVDDNQTQVT